MEDEKLQEIYSAIDADDTMSDAEKTEAKTLAKISYEDSLETEVEETEGKEEDLQAADAVVNQEVDASDTESQSEDGSSGESEETVDETVKDDIEEKEISEEEVVKNNEILDDLRRRQEAGDATLTEDEIKALAEYDKETERIQQAQIPPVQEQVINYKNQAQETYQEVVDNYRNGNYPKITGRKSSTFYEFDDKGRSTGVFKDTVTDEMLFELRQDIMKDKIYSVGLGVKENALNLDPVIVEANAKKGDQKVTTGERFSQKVKDDDGNFKWYTTKGAEIQHIRNDVNIKAVEESINTAIQDLATLKIPYSLADGRTPEQLVAVDLSDREKFMKVKNTVMQQFLNENEEVKNQIQVTKSNIKYDEQMLKFRTEYAQKHPINNLADFVQNFDKVIINGDGSLSYKEVIDHGTSIMNQAMGGNDDFYNMLALVDEQINDKLKKDYGDYIVNSNTPALWRYLNLFGAGHSFQGALDTMGISLDKGKSANKITLIAKINTGLRDSNINSESENGFEDDAVGYFMPDWYDKTYRDNMLVMKGQGYPDPVGNNPYQFYVQSKADKENFPPGMKKHIMTFGEYKNKIKELQEEESKSLNKLNESLLKDRDIASYFPKYSEEEFAKGKNMANNLASLAFESGPNMLLALTTLGTGPGFIQAQESYLTLLQNTARKKYGLKKNEEPTTLQLIEMLEDEPDLATNLKFRANVTGAVYGGVEAAGSYFVIGKSLKPVIGTVVRGQMREMLAMSLKTGVALNFKGLAEGVTEFFQELTLQIGDKSGIEMAPLYQSFRTGYLAGVTLGSAGPITQQLTSELKAGLYKLSGMMGKNETQAYLKNVIKELDAFDTSGYGPQQQKDFDDKRKAFVDYEKASRLTPSMLTGEARKKYINIAVKKLELEREGKEANEEGIKDLEFELENIKKDVNLLEALQNKAGNLELLFNESDTNESVRVGKTTEESSKIIEELTNDNWIINEKDSTNYGNIYNRGEETIVVLNLEEAVSDKKIATTEHEFLHALLRRTFQGRPKAQKAVAQSLSAYLQKLEGGWDGDSNFGRRLSQYKKRQSEGKITEAEFYEETMTLFAEGLVEGEIKMPKNRLKQISAMFTKMFRSAMVAAGLSEKQVEDKFEFNKPEDVAEFIMNATKSIETGKLTEEQKLALSPGGIEGSLLTERLSSQNQESDKAAASASLKENKKQISEETQDKVILDLDLIKDFKKEESAALDSDGETFRKNRGLTTLENSVIESISPTVNAVAENRTKALFDNIPVDLRAGLTREQYRQGLIDDMNLMVLNEYDSSKQGLEEFIVNRGFLRAYSKATSQGVKQQFDFSIDEVGTEVADTAEWADASTEDVMVRKEISPTSLLSEEDQILATQSVADYVANNNIDINSLNYNKVQKLRTAASSATANFFNVPENKIVIGKNNLNASESLNARMAINKNADALLAMLPEGYITSLGAPESLIGTSTGVGNTLLKLFYTKSEKRGKNNTPWILRKDISRKEFLAAFGIQADGKFNPKADGQRIKALMVLMQGNVTNEILRGLPGLTVQGRFNIEKGKSKSMASLKDTTGIEGFKFIKEEETIIGLSQAFDAYEDEDGNKLFANMSAEQARTSMQAFMTDEVKFMKENPEEYSVVREFTYNEMQARAEEGRDTQGFTTVLKDESRTEQFNIDYPGLRDSLTMSLMSDAIFMGDTNAGIAARTQFKNQGLDFAAEIGALFNFNTNMPGPGGKGKGSNPVTFMTAFFGGHRRQIGAADSLVTSDYKVNLKKMLTDGDGRTTIFSDELVADLQSFNFGDLTTTYATELKNNFATVMEIKDPAARKLAAAKLFGTKGAKAQAKMYDLWNRALEEWLHVEVPGSAAFNKKADYIYKLKKNNSSAGITGERILSPPGYVYLGESGDSYVTKVEHLMPSSNMSVTSADLILKNQWQEKGVESLGKYQSIYGRLDDFNKIDAATGRVNSSLEMRFAYNLDLAKDIYKIDGGFKISLYDEMKKQIYDVEGRGKVSGEVLIQEIETTQENIFNHNSALLHDLGQEGLIPVTNVDNPKYASNELLMNNVLEAQKTEADKNLMDLTDTDNVQTAKASIKENNDSFVTDMTDEFIANKATEVSGFINEAIEFSTGINRNYTYSDAKGRMAGDNVTRSFLNTVIPYSAEDFRGLLYVTLGKGEKGDKQMEYYKKNILDPFNKAEGAVTKRQVALANDFQALKKQFPSMPKTLKEKVGIDEYTHSDALRTYIWAQQGEEIPGLSKTDQRKLINYVNQNPELLGFAEGIQGIQQGENLQSPDKNWLAGNLASDLLQGVSKGRRKDYLDQSGWTANIDAMFSPANLNKMRAAYGNSYVEALKDNLRRMKSGSNRPVGGNRITDNLMEWMNNSVGTVMFLNTRSAVLQTLSSVNFVNWTDNNPLAAGKAIVNVKQYSADFMRLMNSEYLVNRRSGLKINVSESEIADAMKEGGQGPKAMINLLLNKGFVFTQYADSFAIASGGATFFRNRTNTYLKTKNPKTGELYTAEEAEALAFIDFESISEESQQSARTDRISMQQASGAGRIVLAFANTPMQYMRIQKKAMQDILAGRGDTKSNISKLAYYGVIQNVAFNAIQNALYTEMFEDDEEDGEVGKDTKAKSWDIINGMLDSSLRGMGIGGAGVSAMKNSILTLADEATKKSPRFIKAIDDLFDFSPPLDSKVRKLKSAANTFSWERDTMEKQGFDIDNPAMLASAQVLSAFTNIPADRALMKLNNLRNAASKRAEAWQTIALLLGVSAWEVGMPYYGVETMQEESDRIKEDDEKELLRLAKLEKARLAKLAKKREARRKLEERIRADERKRIEKENKKKKNGKK